MGSVVQLPSIRDLESKVLALTALNSQLIAVLVDRGVITEADSLAVLCGAEMVVELAGEEPDELIYKTGFNVRHYDTYSDGIEERVEVAMLTLEERDEESRQEIFQSRAANNG